MSRTVMLDGMDRSHEDRVRSSFTHQWEGGAMSTMRFASPQNTPAIVTYIVKLDFVAERNREHA
jgi:hypothetical protein